jgi:PPOX class probable F420-dependent enzyme
MTSTTVLAAFDGQNYLNLETFRKSGEGVKTPVWFVEDGGKFYVTTQATSGKVKRLRRSGQVRVAPCEVNGTPKGEWVEARARVVSEPAVAARVEKLLDQKYGVMKKLFSLQNLFRPKQEMAVIEISLG